MTDKEAVAALLRDVETASERMRRYYRIVRETMRAMAGYLPKMALWTGKKLLARHIWLDSMHADLLRSRTLELRYPRVDADDLADRSIVRVLEKLPTARSDEQFLLSVYRVVKPAMLASLQGYAQGCDPLDDAPTLVYSNRIIAELSMEIDEFRRTFPELAAGEAPTEWEGMLEALIAASGGLEGPDADLAGAPHAAYLDGPDYVIPPTARRDPSWAPAVMQVPPRPVANFIEKTIWVAIDHANEVWAAETPAAMMWEYRDVPWELHLHAARWCYDEMRHAMMGVERLAALGLQAGIDVPMVPDHWNAFRSRGIRHLLLLLHRLEQNGPKHKANLKVEFSEANDLAASQDCDFDWADESGHISFGLAWLKAVFPEWSKQQLIVEGNRIQEEWMQWMEARHRDGTHGYEKFMEKIDRRVAQLTHS